jgi:enamine deaminase RidA (YjgF/YER057c/UK114 family)
MAGGAMLSVAWHGQADAQAHWSQHRDSALGVVSNGMPAPNAADCGMASELPMARVHLPLLGDAPGAAMLAGAPQDEAAPQALRDLAHAAAPLLYETWCSDSVLRSGRHRDVRFRCNDEVLFGSISVEETDLPPQAQAYMQEHNATPLTAAAYAAYAAVFETLVQQGFDYLLRIWNYVPEIVAQRDGSERYWQFNSGRQAAFRAAGRSVSGAVPAACALGSAQGPLTVFFIATRRAPITLENPRQISAFNYPRQYGPSSPTFARGVCLDQLPTPYLFISGTASIVGHETLHRGDVVLQTRETLANLQAVVAQANRLEGLRSGRAHFVLAQLSLRVYLRHAEDFARVRDELMAAFADAPQRPPMVYVRADICRADLLVEIEASGGYPMTVAQ